LKFWQKICTAPLTFVRKPGLSSCAVMCAAGLATAGLIVAQEASPDGRGKLDGPAELPRVYLKTSLADTPAPGKTHAVQAGKDLQAAFDNASCGDTLKLEAGATFTGRFRLVNKHCDDGHWIIIRTSAPDSALPPEGTRLTPCYAGVPSLPGRPDFGCISTKNVMARITFAGKGGNGPILFMDGANHYRFIGVEITRESSPASVVALAGPDERVAADQIIFDRVWMHGTAHDETRRGVFLSGTTNVAIVDSFLSDFHCVAKTGACVDSQAIAGASGDLRMGPFKIVNNFLEAAGENIILGGAKATATPADVEIRHNYLFKPIIWMPGQPGFVGGNDGMPFIVKNHFELKNAERVLFEGNVMENSWGGFSQKGFSIVLSPMNQDGGRGTIGLCPICAVTDVTIRYCKIAHVGGGLQVVNVPADGGNISRAGERYSIHDVVIDDIDGKKYGGFGLFMLLASNQPTLKDVKIDHVTAISSPRVFLNLGIKHGKIQNFVFTNNLVGANEAQITSTGGGPENCVFQPGRQGPAGIFRDCFDSLTFTNNAIINGSGSWPPGNFFPNNAEAVGFAKGSGGWDEYRLCKSKDAVCKGPSKYAGAANDHKDIGADLDAVNAATKGAT
jgi:hypothetical protein